MKNMIEKLKNWYNRKDEETKAELMQAGGILLWLGSFGASIGIWGYITKRIIRKDFIEHPEKYTG